MPATKGATVSVFGRKVSWDAILIAGAGVAGVIFMFRAGQPAGAALDTGSAVDSGGAPVGTAAGALGDPPPNPTSHHFVPPPIAVIIGGGGGQGISASGLPNSIVGAATSGYAPPSPATHQSGGGGTVSVGHNGKSSGNSGGGTGAGVAGIIHGVAAIINSKPGEKAKPPPPPVPTPGGGNTVRAI